MGRHRSIYTHLQFENVDLEEDTFSRVLLGARREHRGYLLASTARGGHEVDHHLIDRRRVEDMKQVADKLVSSMLERIVSSNKNRNKKLIVELTARAYYREN